MDVRIGFDNEDLSSLNSRDTLPSKQLSIASENNNSQRIIVSAAKMGLPKNGDYIRVETGFDDEIDDADLDEIGFDESPLEDEICCRWWNRTLMPDKSVGWGGSDMVDVSGVKFFKLLIWTFLGIILVHFIVRWLDYEHDEDYTLKDMVLFDSNLIVLDVMVFYTVGRLFNQNGIDHAAWLLIAFASSIQTSWMKRFQFLQHSFSLFSIHCKWPWQLWVFTAFMTPVFFGIIGYHIRQAAREGRFQQKVFEFGLGWVIFVVPYVTTPNYHIHHWYAFWALGMHANFDTWWSRATMAWCWGQYVNGIAVYGRDPVLTCATAFYYSTNQKCSFMECALNGDNLDEDSSSQQAGYTPMDVPDWRHCDGYSP